MWKVLAAVGRRLLFLFEGPGRPWWARVLVFACGIPLMLLGGLGSIVGVSLIMLGGWWIMVRRWQVLHYAKAADNLALGRCPECSYNLGALRTSTCPECGTDTTGHLRSIESAIDAEVYAGGPLGLVAIWFGFLAAEIAVGFFSPEPIFVAFAVALTIVVLPLRRQWCI